MAKIVLPAGALCEGKAVCGRPALWSNRHIIKILLVMTPSEARSHRSNRNSIVLAVTTNEVSSHRSIGNFLLAMKLTMILLTVGCLHVCANGVSQNITFSGENVSLKSVFSMVKKQTGFVFIFNQPVLKSASPVSIHAENVPLTQFLDEIFKSQPLKFSIKGKVIAVSAKTLSGSEVISTGELPPLPIKGRITDENGAPLAGASVSVKGSKSSTSSGADGSFSINANDGDIIKISYIGYSGISFRISQSNNNLSAVVVSSDRQQSSSATDDDNANTTGEGANDRNGRNSSVAADIGRPLSVGSSLPLGPNGFSITLSKSASALNEVVINAGYYNVKDRERTGSITKVDAKTIERQPVTNPLQTLQGRVPGMTIIQQTGVPGSNFQVRIRGTNSIRNGNNPLFVIDGIPFSSERLSDDNTGGGLYGNGQGISPLNSINPGDILSVEVLKDADATAIYGSRGANGVVLITTKKGKAGKVTLDINAKSGISQAVSKLKMLNTQQYLLMRQEALFNDGLSASSTDYDINGTWDQTRYTDWQKELIGSAANMSVFNATFSGGSKETQFLFSTAYNTETTVFPGTDDANRFSTHFAITHVSSNKKFTANFSTSYSLNINNIISSDLTGYALQLAPNAPALYDATGKLNWENSTWVNPLALSNARFESKTYNLFTNAELGYVIKEGLRFKINIGISDLKSNESNAAPSSVFAPALGITPASSTLNMSRGSTQSWIAEPQMNWEKRIGKGVTHILVGSTFQRTFSERVGETFRGFASDALINDPRSAFSFELTDYNYSVYKYAAVYARFNYNWGEKYLLNLTGRRDGSSRFGPGRQFANLGAIGAGWIFSNEKFVNIPFLSFGKMRGSIGITGNDQIGDYKFLDAYISGGGIYQDISGLFPAQLFNEDYGWETNKKIEGAVDLGFLKDKIFITVAYFRNRASNQLVDYKLAGTTGFPSVVKNLPATVQNTGTEIEISTVNINAKSLRWTTSFNISFLRNKLVAFPNIESSSYYRTYEVGKSLNISKRYHFTGVDAQTGIYQFEDVNKDGTITLDDRQTAIEPIQDFFGGLGNNFSFNGFQAEIFFQFVKQKRDRYVANSAGLAFFNQPEDVFHSRWQKPGDISSRQRFSTLLVYLQASQNYSSSDVLISDASFIRLKNVSLSYQFPKKWLSCITTRVYLLGQNILTISKFAGLDPETGPTSLPPLRTITAGIQLTF